MEFYIRILKLLIAERKLDPSARTLVVAGGQLDRSALMAAGFVDVVISNLDVRKTKGEFAPYEWSLQDAEALEWEDGSFDQVIEHMGLHHCRSPHRALLEMYRVAKKAVLVFENRDSFFVRLAARIGLTGYYETEAVAATGGKFGGVRNTGLPNYVYRWTEREVEKTLSSMDPARAPKIRYFYDLRLPERRLAMRAHSGAAFLLKLVTIPANIASKVFPKQVNEFGFFAEKDGPTWPWVNSETGLMNEDFIRNHVKSSTNI